MAALVSESGKARRHAADFFVRRADGTGVLIDVRPDHLVRAGDSAVFAATAAMAGQAGWAYDRVGELPAARAANLRWLAGYRHPRYDRAAMMAALAEVFAEPGPLRAGAAEVGDPVAVLPVLFAMLWRGRLRCRSGYRGAGFGLDGMGEWGVRELITRHPVLRPGDMLRLGGATHTVAGLDSVTVRLADVTGAVIEVPTAGLLADPSLELVTGSRVPMAPQPALERLPAETVETARWWERHLIEVITGVPPDSPPGTRPARPTTRPGGRCGSGSWPSTGHLSNRVKTEASTTANSR